MKNIYKFGNSIRCAAAFIALMLVAFYSNAQCPTGNLLFTTQGQVDNFIIQYPNCTQIQGEIFIGEFNANSDITNLQGFQNITSVNGEMKIEFNDNLVDLTGLNNLNNVTGRLWIYSNMALTSLNGLQNLTTVGGNVVLQNNVALVSLNGLNQLQTVNGFFQLRDSDQLTSLVGLDNLSSVNGFEVAYMEGLTSLAGVENLTNFGDYVNLRSLPLLNTFTPIVDNLNSNTRLQLGGMTALTDLQGFSGLTAIGDFAINFNENLASLNGLQNLTTGSISLIENPVLNDLSALSNFTNVTNITIGGNNSLTSLSAFSNLTSMQGDLQIMGNPLITNLEGFNNLTSIGGDLDIGIEGFAAIFAGNVLVGIIPYDENNLIDDLSALSNLTTIGGNLLITNNDVLTSLQGLTNLVSIDGMLKINNTTALTSLSGLNGLTTIISAIEIKENSALQNLNGLNNVTGTTTTVEISNNNQLNSLNGLDNLQNVFFNLTISENNSLTNLGGFDQLNSVGGFFSILNNASLTSFEGLNSLTAISGLNITGNSLLTDISNLQNVQGLEGFLRLQDNPLLNFCSYQFLCDYFENNIGAWFIIAGNGAECVYEEIIEACDDSPLTLDCPADVSLVLPEGATSLVATWADPVVSNTCAQDGFSVVQTSGPTSGEVLTEGSYTVNYEVTNDCNNTSNCSIEITILPTPIDCNVNVIADQGVITVTGLTGEENTKLYNEDIIEVWVCNPWDGPSCTDNEVITGLPSGTYFLSVQSYNCDEWITVVLTDGSGCEDIDNDGICAEEDCNDFDANFPATPGAPCNDFNSNTTNDVITPDGCDCEGTPISSECNIAAQAYNDGASGAIDISGLAEDFNVKLFDLDFNIVWECNPWNGNVCTPSFTFVNTGTNDQFFLSVQADNCNEWIPITIPGDLDCNDADNDGICDDVDCAPNDNTLPTTVGAACDDANDFTENDVIQSDGCTCAGTPIGGGCNVNVTQTGTSELTITGLTASANTKLFDATVSSIVWECNPWDAGVCSNSEVVNLPNVGTQYFLSVQSENCNEWIPIEVPAASVNMDHAFAKKQNEANTVDIKSLFPNPGIGEVFMKIESTMDGSLTIAFHDVVGKLSQQNKVSIEKGTQTFQLDISNLNTGVYHVTIQDAFGQITVERFVKM